jgi:hypothetical protein
MRETASAMSKADNARTELDLPAHGATTLPSVTVNSYNVEIEDEEGFVGDQPNKGVFWNPVSSRPSFAGICA